MRKIPQSFLVLTACVVIAVITMIVFVQFSSTETTSAQKERILLYDNAYNGQESVYYKVSEYPTDKAWFFVYPSSVKFNVTENTYQTFLLIRLPVWLGGDKNDVSAFRAYSAVDLASHCIIKYWPDEGRQRIEDPCTSPAYRVIDGVSVYPGMRVLRGMSTGALPQLVLSIDKDGYLVVEPPTWTPDKNGSIGIGRNVSREEILKSSEFLLQSYKKFSGINLDIPVDLENGEVLIDLNPSYDGVEIFYADPDSVANGVRIGVRFCNCTSSLDDLIVQHENEKYKQFWQVGDTFLSVTGAALNESEDKVPSTYTPYLFEFVKDKYEISFEINQPFEKSAKIVLDNFFDGANLFDMRMIM